MAEIDPRVAQILRRIKPGQDEQRTRLDRYNHSYDVYRASQPRSRNRRPWESDMRVPYGRQVLDTELVNIVTGQPKVIIRPRHPQWTLAAKAMQYVMDYEIAEDQFSTKQPTFAQQGLIFGTTVAKNHWLYLRRDGRAWNAMTEKYEKVENSIVVRDGPTFEPWSIYRTYWSPGARSADDAEYVVLQTYMSKADLETNRYNPDNGSGLYQNLDDLYASGQAKTLGQQTSQANYLGLGDTRIKDKFLIEEVWTSDFLFVLGNGQVLLRASENPYQHGRKPIVIAQIMPDLFELQGIADTEAVDHIQQALWTNQNLRIDNAKFTVHRGITYREGGVTDPDALELRPRFKWPVADHDDIRPFEAQPLPPEAYEEEKALLSNLQLVTGVNPYVSGSDLQTVDQNTATGVTALQEVAGRLLRFKAKMLEDKGYLPSFQMWGDMIQQYMTDTVAVEIIGQGNDVQWVQVAPHDIAGHFRYSIEGSEESLSRQQERGEALALLNAFAPMAQQVPGINWQMILERVAAAYDFPNPEALFQPPASPAQAAPAAPGQPNFNVLGPRLGMVPNQGVGAVQIDPQLAQALGNTGQQPIGPDQFAQRPYRLV